MFGYIYFLIFIIVCFQAKIEALENELIEVKAERDRLTTQCLQTEKERQEEMKIIQEVDFFILILNLPIYKIR